MKVWKANTTCGPSSEITELLGAERAKTFCYVYDITPQGNWEDHNILNMPKTIDQAAKLLCPRPRRAGTRARCQPRHSSRRARETRAPRHGHQGPRFLERIDDRRSRRRRTHPGRRALSPRGERAAGFILDQMRRRDGRLLHTFKDGQAKLDAYLDDYAGFIDGLTRLYESTGEPRWIESALELAAIMIDEFADPEQGGFYFTGRRHEALIARQKDIHDNATPSGNGLAATALLRLGALTGRKDLPHRASRRSRPSSPYSSASRPRVDKV